MRTISIDDLTRGSRNTTDLVKDAFLHEGGFLIRGALEENQMRKLYTNFGEIIYHGFERDASGFHQRDGWYTLAKGDEPLDSQNRMALIFGHKRSRKSRKKFSDRQLPPIDKTTRHQVVDITERLLDLEELLMRKSIETFPRGVGPIPFSRRLTTSVMRRIPGFQSETWFQIYMPDVEGETVLSGHIDYEPFVLIPEPSSEGLQRYANGSWQDIEIGRDEILVLPGFGFAPFFGAPVPAVLHRVKNLKKPRAVVMHAALALQFGKDPLSKMATQLYGHSRPQQYLARDVAEEYLKCLDIGDAKQK